MNYLIGARTRVLPAFCIVPQPSMPPRAPHPTYYLGFYEPDGGSSTFLRNVGELPTGLHNFASHRTLFSTRSPEFTVFTELTINAQ
jgi:hypothetical protein